MKTYEKIKERFYWKCMATQIKDYVLKCKVCLEVKRKYGKVEGFLIPLEIAPHPFHTIGIDFLKIGSAGSFLVIVDYFSKWAEVFKCASEEAETVAKVLFFEIFTRHGAPRRLISDRGTSFLNAVVEKVNALFGVLKVNTSAYHPQTDGLVERFNNTLLNIIRSYIENESHINLVDHIKGLLFSYRTAVHPSTGFTPFFLLYNRHPVLPIDLQLRINSSNDVIVDTNVKDYADQIRNMVKRTQWFAHKNLQRAQVDQKKYVDQSRREVSIKVGDFVYMKVEPDSDKPLPVKLQRKWQGPYKVINKVNENAFRIEFDAKTRRHSVINVQRLKKI